MADQLTADQIADFRDTFALFDTDGDGSITTKEFGTVLRCLSLNPTENELKSMIKELDPDNTGNVDFPGMLTVISRKLAVRDSEAEILEAFRVFDQDGNGFITEAQLREVLTSLGEKLSDEEIDTMHREVDVERDSVIPYEQFVKRMLSK